MVTQEIAHDLWMTLLQRAIRACLDEILDREPNQTVAAKKMKTVQQNVSYWRTRQSVDQDLLDAIAAYWEIPSSSSLHRIADKMAQLEHGDLAARLGDSRNNH